MTRPLTVDPAALDTPGRRFWAGLFNGLALSALLWAAIAGIGWIVVATVAGR